MSEHRHAVIGSPANFWLYSSKTGFDLTHPPRADSPLIHPRIPIETTTERVTIDPAKSALVVVDMQNFFLSPLLERPKDSKGLKACDQLIKYAIPACRKAGIRIVWLNWGLTQWEIDEMPPATLRAFGFSTSPDVETAAEDQSPKESPENVVRSMPSRPRSGKDPRLYKGLGSAIGPVKLEDGTSIDGGRLLMRDQWNSALVDSLQDTRMPEDVWIHKNRMSGLWGAGTPCTEYLESQGIRTLFFAGVNTDQCVAGSLQDAFTKGYDCLLLDDGCATTTPEDKGGQTCVEYNTARAWGFTLSCENLARGVANLEH